MTFRTTIHPDENLLHTTFTGFISVEELHGRMGAYVALALEHRCHRWLLDFSGATFQSVSLLEIMNHPDNFRRATAPLRAVNMEVVQALVISGQQTDLKFLETVTFNRGQTLRVFNSIDPALQWLRHTSVHPAPRQPFAPTTISG